MIRFNFISSNSHRKKQVQKAKKLYHRFLTSSDYNCVFGFIDHQLNSKPEKTDVIHDFLAHLADQMVAFNKKKEQEEKGFLSWFENYLGTDIDCLANKTKFRKYYELPWENLLKLLKQNQRKISKVDISLRNPQEKVKKEFEDSISKLNPLYSHIQSTDKLINQIVYKLYRLKEEEIRIIEDEIGG